MAPATRPRLVLLAAIMGSFVAGLDATAVNVALPAIERDLGGGLAGQQWVVNGYLLALGSLILVGGSLGDVLGARRVFSLGVAGFGVASVACAAAPSIELLVGARVVQGAFGALLTPSALAVIVAAFPGDRGPAIGTWTAWSGIATVVGPFAGGWLVDAASWRWIFLVNVPFVLVTLALVRVAIPARAAGRPQRSIDWSGAALCAAGLAGGVYGLIRQPQAGWASPSVVLPIAAGVALLAAFLLHEARAPDPMLPLGLFRRRNFAVGNVETFSMYGGLASMSFLLVLFLQQVAGYDALEAGLATMPTTLVLFALSKRFGALADRLGPRVFMGGGPLLAAVGLAWFVRMPADVDYVVDVLPGVLVFALGLAITVAPLTAAILADADASDAGIASGVNNAVARVAALVAIAAVGAVVAGTFTATAGDALPARATGPEAQRVIEAARRRTLARADTSGLPPAQRGPVARAVQDASVHAFHVGMGISAALIGLGGALGLVGIVNPRRRVAAEACSGGQVAGAPADAAQAR
ncbi:MAG TPA: DHA2 family efflux MFS transporter permease subunit [Baekduia sp.]|nr:DHA2 family efflux MFS transporter permease subunit [Baekduia sp.]